MRSLPVIPPEGFLRGMPRPRRVSDPSPLTDALWAFHPAFKLGQLFSQRGQEREVGLRPFEEH